MRNRNIKCYVTLNEADEINSDIVHIFDHVSLFTSKQFTGEKLFKLLKYEAGDRLINYKFPLTSSGVVVSSEAIEDIQTYVDLFTDKFKYKYLALLESEDFEYDPLDNTDIHEEKGSTRTPNLSGTVTDTVNKTNTKTLNTSDADTKNLTRTFGDTNTKTFTNLKEKTTYNSTVGDSGSIQYGKTDTTTVSNSTSTNSVIPYDQVGTWHNQDKNESASTTTDNLGGTDTNSNTRTYGGNDEKTKTGSEADAHTGTIRDSGTDTITHTGNVTTTDVGSIGKTTSQTGTETINDEMTRTGFQPQYSISSRQDMVNKYRDVSNFSTVGVYIKEIADYILLGYYSNLEHI